MVIETEYDAGPIHLDLINDEGLGEDETFDDEAFEGLDSFEGS